MRTFSTFLIILCLALALSTPALAQQPGGLRIMEPAEEGVCKDESVPGDDASGKNVRRQTELARELLSLLKRTAEIQKKLSAAGGKDVQAELSWMIERTKRMAAELEGMAGGAKAP